MVTIDSLKKIPILSAISDTELTELASVLRIRTVPKGNIVVYEQDDATSMMFIQSGEVKVTLSSSDGKEVVLALLGPGDFFGEISLLTGEKRSANVVTASDCEFLVLSEADFLKHLNNNSGLALQMLRELASRLRFSSSQIGDLALYDVYRRVARTLKAHAVETKKDGEMIFLIEKRPTHQELASMVGTSREMVTRALKGLEEDGCIEIVGKGLIVKSLPR
jgi:CRP-like cAMP-binding protein